MSDKYKSALSRNLNEARDACFEWQTLVAIESVQYPFPEASFFDIVHNALRYSVVAHLVKLLDDHKDTASFWYIYEKKKDEIEARNKNKEKVERLRSLVEPLKHIRDKTHFHIDRKAVVDPKKIWNEAGIAPEEARAALSYIIDILQPLQDDEYGCDMSMDMDYDDSEAKQLVEIAKIIFSNYSD